MLAYLADGLGHVSLLLLHALPEPEPFLGERCKRLPAVIAALSEINKSCLPHLLEDAAD